MSAEDGAGEGSITWLLHEIKAGNSLAELQLWERCRQILEQHARPHLRSGSRRMADEEDVALSAFHQFLRGVQAGRFPSLDDRDDLWAILLKIVRDKSADYRDRLQAEKRGGTDLRGESAFGSDESGRAGIAVASGDGWPNRCAAPQPDEEAMLAELIARLPAFLAALAPELRIVAELKLQQFANTEIAERVGKSESLVRARLKSIQAKLRKFLQ
jgi:RNA polymerase sigma factor (sigma-70 family)